MASSTRQSRLLAEQELSKLGKVGLLTTSELFAATNALLSSPQLRSALSDPSAQAAGKSKLVEAVLGPKLSKETVGLLGKMAQMRWSATRDLALTAEALGVRAAAAASKDIDVVQAELFAVGQLVSSDPQLELALSSTRASVEAKMVLVAKLLNNKASETTPYNYEQVSIFKSSVLVEEYLEDMIYLGRFVGPGRYGKYLACGPPNEGLSFFDIKINPIRVLQNKKIAEENSKQLAKTKPKGKGKA